MLTSLLAPLQPAFLAFWHTLRGHPLRTAVEAHQAAVRALYRCQVELSYHDQLKTYFDAQARGMDPHNDWHMFALLKDEWQEHIHEIAREQRRLTQVEGKVMATTLRLQKLQQQP